MSAWLAAGAAGAAAWWLDGRRVRRIRRLSAALGREVSGAVPAAGGRSRSLLLAGAVVALTAAAAARPPVGPDAGTPVEDVGERPVVVAVDLSRSMRVADVGTTRIEAARLVVHRLLAEMPARSVALVGFAGTAHVLVPPTRDHTLLRTWADALYEDAATGGATDLAAALDTALTLDASAVVLITDGEDFAAAGSPGEAAARASAAGMAVHAVVVGTEAGGVVPDGGGARSRADAQGLRAVVGGLGQVTDPGAVRRITAQVAPPSLPPAGPGLPPAPAGAAWAFLAGAAFLVLVVESWRGRRAEGVA
ncbi:MAG: VWA domain-containing protein [Longimicrobiales bacterium]